jgi:hypothetical protein
MNEKFISLAKDIEIIKAIVMKTITIKDKDVLNN